MFQNITSLCFETYIRYTYAVSSWCDIIKTKRVKTQLHALIFGTV